MESLADLLSFIALLLIFIASQLFWVRRVREMGEKLIVSKRWRRGLGGAGLIVYLFLLVFNGLSWNTDSNKGSSLTFRAILLDAPFWLWFVGSMLGFLIAILLGTIDRVVRALNWSFKKVLTPQKLELPSPGRRRFLEQSAIALSAAPFVAGVYGLFYGRLNLETTHKRIPVSYTHLTLPTICSV